MEDEKLSESLRLHQENERNIRLAKVLGWPPEQIRVTLLGVAVGKKSDQQILDYKSPDVSWRIAVAWDAFPCESASKHKKEWIAVSGKSARMNSSKANTPELATLLAVLEASKTYTPPRIEQ